MPRLQRWSVVAIAVLATAAGTAACGPSHYHPIGAWSRLGRGTCRRARAL